MDSPEKLQQAILKKTTSLGQQKSEVESIERQCRALQTSTEAFGVIEGEINACIKLLEDCEAEILRYEELATKVARQTDALEKKKTDIRSKERTQEVTQIVPPHNA
jgi:kinetochore protein Nuf2